jgi:hypothetical protein
MKTLGTLFVFTLLTLLAPQIAYSQITIGLEINNYEPTDQDVILGSAVVPGLAGNDQLSYSTDTGYRLFVGGTNWRLSWLSLDYTGDYAAGARGGNYFVALDHPTSTYGPYNSVAADSKIELEVIDLDYLISINTAGPSSVLASFGLRYATYENNLQARYDGGAQNVTQNAKNDLLGLRAGMEGRFPFALQNNLAFLGKISIAILAGDSEFTHTESLGNLQRNVTWSSTVPVFDAGLSLDYRIKLAPQILHVWLGYDLIRFEDVATTQSFTDSSSLGSQVQPGNEAGFQGWKVGFSYEF